LAGRFTEIGFNLALALPFFGSAVTPAHPLFQAGLDSSYAMAAGRARNAHVRLVDTETPPESLAGATPEAIAERLASLAAACAARGAILSVENARQPWALLRRAFLAARERLGERAPA